MKFKPYPLIENATSSLESLVATMTKADESGEFDAAIGLSYDLMQLGLQGLRYLQTYNWLFLRTLVTLGFIGWILYALTSFLEFYILPKAIKPSLGSVLTPLSMVILASIFGTFYLQHAPIMHYLYAVFPVAFWETVLEYRASLWEGLKILIWNSGGKQQNTVGKLMVEVIAFFALMEAIVAGYFHREVFSVIYALLSTWPMLQNYEVAKKSKALVLTWVVSCFVMSSFTLLPVIKVESITQILVAGSLMTIAGLSCMIYLVMRPSKELSSLTTTILGVQLGIVVLSMTVTCSTVKSLQSGKGLPFGNQIVGWIVLAASILTPLVHMKNRYHDYRTRLLIIFLAFAPTFILLTISYEGLFYVTFFINLVCWVDLELKIYEDRRQKEALAAPRKIASKLSRDKKVTERRLELADIRIALFFFFLTQIAFFGTGNIASISSFSLDSVYRLLPVFDPFAMGALLLFKILVPFAVISADLGLLTQRLGVKPSSLFTMVLSISDILTLNFFYLVLDEGSWLDIGMSISHYCIASLLCVFVIALEYFSETLVSGVTVEENSSEVEVAEKQN